MYMYVIINPLVNLDSCEEPVKYEKSVSSLFYLLHWI